MQQLAQYTPLNSSAVVFSYMACANEIKVGDFKQKTPTPEEDI